MNRGYVKLHRKTLDSPVWDLPPEKFKVWSTCLILANYEDRKWSDGAEEIVIPRGSFVTSTPKLAQITRLGRQAVRGSLATLSKMRQIATKVATNRYTMITVVNYEIYQGATPEATKVPTKVATKRQPTSNHNEEVKNKRLLTGDSAPAGPDLTGRNPHKAPDPNVKRLIDYYYDRFRARFQSPPPINGAKDGAIAKKLLAGRTLDEAKWLIGEHLTNPSDFFEEKNLYGLQDVLRNATTLLARRAKLKEIKP